MKFFFVLVFIACCACSKSVVSIGKNDLEGTWVLKRISGGFAGIDSIPKDNITLEFETGGKCISTFNNTITSTGNYTVTKAGEPNYYGSDILLNLITDSTSSTYGLLLKNDSLFISEGCCDQFEYLYTKSK